MLSGNDLSPAIQDSPVHLIVILQAGEVSQPIARCWPPYGAHAQAAKAYYAWQP